MAKNKAKAKKTSIETSGNLERYFEIMDEYPELFRNADSGGSIDLVLDRSELEEEQAALAEENTMAEQPDHFGTLGVLAEDSHSMYLRDLVNYSDGVRVPHERYILKMDLLGGRMAYIVPHFDERILLVRHYVHETRQWDWVLPHGYILPGEDLLISASLELRAMTGLKPIELYPLFQRHDDKAVIFMAETTLIGAGEPSYTIETIGEKRWFTMMELERAILSGMISNAAVLAAFIYLTRAEAGQSTSATFEGLK